ncbi:MAG: tRNA uridine-5-carboxymethylaminomethyl(34) synthesis GTPase MnmE [Vulcanimicrobiaceae bacterium]
MNGNGETIAAVATAAGRGAVGIVRVSGPGAGEIARRVFRCRRPLRPRVATQGTVVAADGGTIDEGLALWFAAPRSYTGEDVLELHVHGSPAVVRETLLATLAAGARLANPGEFTRRAFLAGKMDLSAAEAVAELVAAEHRGAARAAAANLSGGLAREVERQREALDETLAELAAALDFPDEVEAPPRAELRSRLNGVSEALDGLAATWERGRLVREGVSVAIVGPPNAGKSSLLNALLGSDRALVSELAGTTRDTIEETLALEAPRGKGLGFVARLIDTAGIRAHAGRLEAEGIARTERALAGARVALVVVDASQALGGEARDVLQRTRNRERILFFNKADLGRAGYDAREPSEGAAILGSTADARSLAEIRGALGALIDGGPAVDLERPHLATARQADAVLEAARSLQAALATLEEGAPVDLLAGDLLAASAALGELTGRAAGEAILDRIFARFCVGK